MNIKKNKNKTWTEQGKRRTNNKVTIVQSQKQQMENFLYQNIWLDK
jgi:hypothetical protein